MYKLHICISWMSEYVILLPTYIYVNMFIIGECEKPCRLEKARIMERPIYVTTYFFVFNRISNMHESALFDCIILYQLTFYLPLNYKKEVVSCKSEARLLAKINQETHLTQYEKKT